MGNSKYALELFCAEYDKSVHVFSIEDNNIIEIVKREDRDLLIKYAKRY